MSIQEKYALTDEGMKNVKLGAVWTAAANLVVFGGVGTLYLLMSELVAHLTDGRAAAATSSRTQLALVAFARRALRGGVLGLLLPVRRHLQGERPAAHRPRRAPAQAAPGASSAAATSPTSPRPS